MSYGGGEGGRTAAGDCRGPLGVRGETTARLAWALVAPLSRAASFGSQGCVGASSV